MLPAIVRRWMANEPVVVWSCVIGGIGMSVLVCFCDFVLLCFCAFVLCAFVCLKVGITCGLLVLPTLRLCLTPSLL